MPNISHFENQNQNDHWYHGKVYNDKISYGMYMGIYELTSFPIKMYLSLKNFACIANLGFTLYTSALVRGYMEFLIPSISQHFKNISI